ncbi:FtsP/CotA-like multicopper oxidase with cupredoxin domain [Mycolicibacterium sp. BK556]|uniref:multicopper oxidase family protein n=1 Tax=unclassified Mycolicibacterium TaxID=2636767 RepID=UPI001820833F|nr:MULTISPECIES: multicopper oxidase family protein [unclassified Mycolicibacterium]MBB3600871.1 FtsP/CotA-like multicopper oxidase with cupredoxin domain [Mycolicibacterium sp. BK556]MBB3630625.1 FtsP/CotA-like multicopper oxidase with cupredoxin domain [Mycolicibacterium sp. BK607]
MTRRGFLAASVLGGAALVACSRSASGGSTRPGEVAAAEAARPHTGRTVTARLAAGAADIDLGGTKARTLTYNQQVPGPLIRASVGDDIAITVDNALDHPSSVHWHGIALRNDMDGAAPATPNIAPGSSFTYRFSSPFPGTYWAHPHTGLDTDYGLYVPVIVDDPADPGRYDAEWIVMLDDWTSGVGTSPAEIFKGLRSMGGMGHMPGMGGMGHMPGMGGMGAMPGTPGVGGVGPSELLGGDAGDVSYPYYIINGRIPSAATMFSARPGQRIRIRIINAAADTAFRVALAGHRMTVTHTDGFPVVPTDVDAVLLGMGERYDVLVTAGDGVFPLVASAEGKNAVARALLSTGGGSAPDVAFRPPELTGRVGTVDTFTAARELQLSDRSDLAMEARLTGGMMQYDWKINGRPYDQTVPLAVRQGQHTTLTFTNQTMMWHPMHLHGHTFQVIRADGSAGPRKDTVIVKPMQSVSVRFVADNPGDWMLHCHNGYHMDAGMMTTLNYVE